MTSLAPHQRAFTIIMLFNIDTLIIIRMHPQSTLHPQCEPIYPLLESIWSSVHYQHRGHTLSADNQSRTSFYIIFRFFQSGTVHRSCGCRQLIFIYDDGDITQFCLMGSYSVDN